MHSIGWLLGNSSSIRVDPSNVCAPNAIGYRTDERVDGIVEGFVPGEGATFVFPKDEVINFNPLATGDDVQRQAADPEKTCAARVTCIVINPLDHIQKNRKSNTLIRTRPQCTNCDNYNAGKTLTSKRCKEFIARHGKPVPSLDSQEVSAMNDSLSRTR